MDCNPFDKYILETYKLDSIGAVVGYGVGQALRMYVRREIRSLTDEDTAATIDAMAAIWEVDEVTGQEKYGEKFHPAVFFASGHYFSSAATDGDYTHGGHGQNLKLST